jgi:3-oxoacyl-[acyl-carrier-protein] synthase II
MERLRVVITGIGAVTPLGLNTVDFWAGLSAGKSGVDYITYFDTSNYQVKVDAEIKGFDPAEHIDLKIVDRTPRSVHLAIKATDEAMKMAGLDMAKENAERVGIITSTMIENDYIIKGFENLQKRGPRRGDPLFITKISPAVVSSQIGILIGAKGPNSSVNSLCASGADAIGNALNHIRLGHADVMISGGSDASLEATAIAGLNMLGALSRSDTPDKASRPFDLNRNGFVYGEGSTYPR